MLVTEFDVQTKTEFVDAVEIIKSIAIVVSSITSEGFRGLTDCELCLIMLEEGLECMTVDVPMQVFE